MEPSGVPNARGRVRSATVRLLRTGPETVSGKVTPTDSLQSGTYLWPCCPEANTLLPDVLWGAPCASLYPGCSEGQRMGQPTHNGVADLS